MTTVSPTGSDIAASQSSARRTIAGNFDTFLQLLTTQLQNQSPLDPLDTNQFTQQLVQFSAVEQTLKTNDLLATLVSASTASRAAGAAGYLGATITADGSKTTLADGKATWHLNSSRAAAKATVSVIDASGATVYSQTGPMDAGSGVFTWDGRTETGSMLRSGEYTIRIDARDAAGQPVIVSTEVAGVVDALDLTADPPLLKIGSLAIPLDQVKSLRKTSP
jgi:flagellar basal-body rod modification protein FlgD